MSRREYQQGIRKVRKGFTLIELLIVLMIFSVVTALFVANYRRFGNNVTLSNVADEVALSIREMQTYGLASKRTSASETDFRKAFGIYIPAGNTNSAYSLFQDTVNGDRRWNNGSENVSQYSLPSDITFSRKCVNFPDDLTVVGSSDAMHITFKRPDPNARIYIGNSGPEYVSAGICLRSGQTNKEKTVVVTQSGQIEVVDDCLCNS